MAGALDSLTAGGASGGPYSGFITGGPNPVTMPSSQGAGSSNASGNTPTDASLKDPTSPTPAPPGQASYFDNYHTYVKAHNPDWLDNMGRVNPANAQSYYSGQKTFKAGHYDSTGGFMGTPTDPNKGTNGSAAAPAKSPSPFGRPGADFEGTGLGGSQSTSPFGVLSAPAWGAPKGDVHGTPGMAGAPYDPTKWSPINESGALPSGPPSTSPLPPVSSMPPGLMPTDQGGSRPPNAFGTLAGPADPGYMPTYEPMRQPVTPDPRMQLHPTQSPPPPPVAPTPPPPPAPVNSATTVGSPLWVQAQMAQLSPPSNYGDMGYSSMGNPAAQQYESAVAAINDNATRYQNAQNPAYRPPMTIGTSQGGGAPSPPAAQPSAAPASGGLTIKDLAGTGDPNATTTAGGYTAAVPVTGPGSSGYAAPQSQQAPPPPPAYNPGYSGWGGPPTPVTGLGSTQQPQQSPSPTAAASPGQMLWSGGTPAATTQTSGSGLAGGLNTSGIFSGNLDGYSPSAKVAAIGKAFYQATGRSMGDGSAYATDKRDLPTIISEIQNSQEAKSRASTISNIFKQALGRDIGAGSDYLKDGRPLSDIASEIQNSAEAKARSQSPQVANGASGPPGGSGTDVANTPVVPTYNGPSQYPTAPTTPPTPVPVATPPTSVGAPNNHINDTSVDPATARFDPTTGALISGGGAPPPSTPPTPVPVATPPTSVGAPNNHVNDTSVDPATARFDPVTGALLPPGSTSSAAATPTATTPASATTLSVSTRTGPDNSPATPLQVTGVGPPFQTGVVGTPGSVSGGETATPFSVPLAPMLQLPASLGTPTADTASLQTYGDLTGTDAFKNMNKLSTQGITNPYAGLDGKSYNVASPYSPEAAQRAISLADSQLSAQLGQAQQQAIQQGVRTGYNTGLSSGALNALDIANAQAAATQGQQIRADYAGKDVGVQQQNAANLLNFDLSKAKGTLDAGAQNFNMANTGANTLLSAAQTAGNQALTQSGQTNTLNTSVYGNQMSGLTSLDQALNQAYGLQNSGTTERTAAVAAAQNQAALTKIQADLADQANQRLIQDNHLTEAQVTNYAWSHGMSVVNAITALIKIFKSPAKTTG